jgi:hypothetical protein
MNPAAIFFLRSKQFYGIPAKIDENAIELVWKKGTCGAYSFLKSVP